ncbi:MAG: TetR/AcrR family transcriptional regulator [Caulobacterales bacterium]
MTQSSNISRRRKSALQEGNAEYVAKRAELVSVAAQLFKDNGYQSTTLADIGKIVGLDRATMYYYVGSKEELFRECIKDGVASNISMCEKIAGDANLTPPERLRKVFEQLMQAYEDNYPHMFVYIQEQMHQVTHQSNPWAQEILRQTRRFEKITIDLIKQSIDQGFFRKDVSPTLAANALFGMFNWTHRWHRPNGAVKAADISKAFCDIFFAGMDRRPARGRASSASR